MNLASVIVQCPKLGVTTAEGGPYSTFAILPPLSPPSPHHVQRQLSPAPLMAIP